MCNRFAGNVELFAMRILLSFELMAGAGITPPRSHAVELFPEGRNPSCMSSCSTPACSQLSESLWGELVCMWDGEGRKESRQNRLKIISAGLGYRTWEKTTFNRYCIVKANITWSAVVLNHFSKWPLFSLFFQPWPFEPSLNSPSLVHTSPGFFLPLLLSLLLCLGSLGLCSRHQINPNFSHVSFTQKTDKM